MYYVHINRGIIDSNRKHGKNDPPIVIKRGRYGRSIRCSDVSISNGRITYTGDTILPCGARVVIETEEMPEVIA